MTLAASAAALALLAIAPADGVPAMPTSAAFAALGDEGTQDLLILGQTRPIIARLRVMVGDRAFRPAWLETTRALHAGLDRDGDGRLTLAEAEAGGLARLVEPPAAAVAQARPKVEVDVNPKDGVISVDELAEGLRATSGPLRLRAEGSGVRRTDVLFDHLDLDKDGFLARSELSAIAGSLRRLDRDDNELISLGEVEVLENPSGIPMVVQGARDVSLPTVAELDAGESPLRLVRMLLRKYDTGSTKGAGRLDSKLSPAEFAIPAPAFEAADANKDGLLNDRELRAYLTAAPREFAIDVALSADANGRASVAVRGLDGGGLERVTTRRLGEGVVEVEVGPGPIRVDIHVDDGEGVADNARRVLRARFEAADANQDGYLEESELVPDPNGQPSPLAGLFRALDRNADGRAFPAEVDDLVARHAVAARGRLTLSAADEGRSLFGMFDLDRDRQLGAREVLDSFARVGTCDRDGDGRVAPDEVPHHIQLTVARGDLSALLAPSPGTPINLPVAMSSAAAPARRFAGPAWFRRMDRNRDGDVSRREFLGTREQFDRLDRDRDGLLDAAEAEAARAVKGPGG